MSGQSIDEALLFVEYILEGLCGRVQNDQVLGYAELNPVLSKVGPGC